MAGRTPTLTGRKAMTGAQGLITEAIDLAEAAGLKPPATLGRLGKLAWREAIATLVPKGNVALIDLRSLEMMARQYEIWANAEREIQEKEKEETGSGEYVTTPNGHIQMSHLRITARQALREYSRLAAMFGATPVARIRTAGTAQGDLFDFAANAPKPDPEDDGDAPTDPTDPYGPAPVAQRVLN